MRPGVLSRINFENTCNSVWGGRPRPRGEKVGGAFQPAQQRRLESLRHLWSRQGRTWRSGAVLEDCPTLSGEGATLSKARQQTGHVATRPDASPRDAT